ncbi:MAG: LamG domain-containing protein, partial [Planctomycetes bacterium]|nr:LamG domain-containing protein [Planctomycetota bacterium]
TDNAYSVALWVKGGPQNDMRIFSEGSTETNTPLLNLGTHNSGSPTGQFATYIRPETGTVSNHPLSQVEPFDDTWHHIVWVDDNGTTALYIDGLSDGGDFNYTRGEMPALNTTSIGGILRADPSYFFTGQIDEVLIYNRALLAGEALGLAGKTEPIHKPFE